MASNDGRASGAFSVLLVLVLLSALLPSLMSLFWDEPAKQKARE